MDTVSARLGLGTWAFSGNDWGAQAEADSIASVHEALERGCTLIDTALAYGSGRSERIVGTAIKGRRDGVRIVTKVPPRNEIWGPPADQPIEEAYDAAWIQSSCEQSLRNLGAEQIDYLLLHTWNQKWPADGEWRDAFEDLKVTGKIGDYGISVDDLGASDANSVIDACLGALELVYNAFYQQAADETLQHAAATGTTVIGRSPLQAGILTGKYQNRGFAIGDWRNDWTPDAWLAQNRRMVREFAVIADENGISTTELALRFALSTPGINTIIVGCRTRDQAAMNFAAAAQGPLDHQIVDRIAALWKDGTVYGAYLGSS